jgi:hypothetical protein
MYPEILQMSALISLPFTNFVEWHSITSLIVSQF